MSILIIDNYDSFTFNLYQMTAAVADVPVEVIRNDALTYEQFIDKAPSKVILSPGPGHPDNASDFGLCRAIIEKQPEHMIPILGVCLGMQGMSSIYGATVTQAPAIVHGKTSMIEVLKEECILFEGLPRPFEAMRYHSLIAEEASIPDCLEITCKDLTHNLVMGVQHKALPLYGVQFHPESIGTPEGQQLLKNFVEKG
jgi:anthranilate synthase component II